MFLFRRQVLALLTAATLTQTLPAAADDTPLTVFAAASLKNALDAIGTAYEASSGTQVTISYAASGALAKQIAEGAPADVFVTADLTLMDWAAEKDLVFTDRAIIAGNALVLVTPADVGTTVDLSAPGSLDTLIGDSRLAIGEAKTVPAGQYGVESLKSLGLWDGVKDRLASVESVRAALALVATGEAAAGIVYASDARAEPKVRVVARFPETSHKPIVYPAAVVTASRHAQARGFVDYLLSAEAQRILADQGFLPPPAGG